MVIPGTKYLNSPIGTYHEPAPDGNPLLKSVRIGSSPPVQLLNRLQRALDRAQDLVDSINPLP